MVNDWDEQYRGYQATLAARFLAPTLRRWGVGIEGARLLEVGCGDGGVAAEFARSGAHVSAIDIDERLVRMAREMNTHEGLEFSVQTGDITDVNCPGLEDGPFDIVLLRDVVEHIEDLESALRITASHLSPDGVIFVVFPPYYSPYGAHQQILPRRTLGPVPYNKLPWLQLLPDALFRRVAAGNAPANIEVMRIRSIRLTLSGFERHVHAAGFYIRRRKFYLSRPTFTLRYGLPVVGAGIIGHIPVLRELFVTAGYFLVGKKEANDAT